MDCLLITLCAGTACVVMDSSQLLLLEEQLPAHLKGRVKIRGARCLDLCRGGCAAEGPYVLIGEEPMPRATPAKVIARAEVLLGKAALAPEA